MVIAAKKYKGDSVVISCRVPRDLLAELDGIAAATGRTRNEIVQMCLEFSVDKIKIEDAGK